MFLSSATACGLSGFYHVCHGDYAEQTVTAAEEQRRLALGGKLPGSRLERRGDIDALLHGLEAAAERLSAVYLGAHAASRQSREAVYCRVLYRGSARR